MKLIEPVYGAGASVGPLVDRLDSAPPIVLIFAAIIGLALVILAIMWLLLPFAIYGLKKRLDEQTAAIDSVRGQLERMQIYFRNQDIPKLSFPDDEPEPEMRTEHERGLVTGERPGA